MVKIFGFEIFKDKADSTPVIGVDELSSPSAFAGQTGLSPWQNSVYDGGKFLNGFGATQFQHIDYWTLRARSDQLFNENLYARGIIKRLITNEINTGIWPEACPEAEILGISEDELATWSETVETRFGIWAKMPGICDFKQKSTFAAIERAARMEALISGDVLIVLRSSPKTKLPMIQLVRGSAVQTPLMSDFKIREGHKINQGVELNKSGRVVAHWIKQPDGTSERLPAFGEKTGRRISWLLYGTEKRLDEVRGIPMLSLVLQSLKEIDRYRDSAQRKAVVNSIVAMFIKKGTDKMGTMPVSGGATRKDSVTTTDSNGTLNNYQIASQLPGVVYEELQEGEEPVLLGGQGTDVNFGTFEASIMQAVAWANEIPPEILTLAFSNNYSASQAAINEFKIYLTKFWGEFGDDFCTPIYNEWLLSETLLGNVKAEGLLQAWRDKTRYAELGAWLAVEWYGSIKPSTDTAKQVKGSKAALDEGWTTNAREARNTTGTKFSKNVKRLIKENQQKADMLRPLLELQAEFGPEETDRAVNALKEQEEKIQALEEHIQDGERIIQ